jgi:hypothetical protein
MTDTNRELLKLVERDPSLTDADRDTLRKIRTGALGAQSADRVLSVGQVAERFGRSKRSIALWARAGVIQRVLLPGRKRACGFRESDVVRLIAGQVAQ